MNHYHQDPVTSIFTGPHRLNVRTTVFEAGQPKHRTYRKAIPTAGFYESVIIGDTVRHYADPLADTLALSGPANDPATVVEVTKNWRDWTLEEVQIQKRQDVDQHAVTLAGKNCQSTRAGTEHLYIRLDGAFGMTILVYAATLSERAKDRTGGPETSHPTTPPPPLPWSSYWVSDLTMRFWNSNNGNENRTDVDEVLWGSVLTSVAKHMRDISQAVSAAYAAIDAAPDADTAKAIDPADPAYGWPPTYDPPS